LELKHILQKLDGFLSQLKKIDFINFWLPYLLLKVNSPLNQMQVANRLKNLYRT